MRVSSEAFQHRVFGIVHEVMLLENDPTAVSDALAHEETVCHANRIVIDLTKIEHPSQELLVAIQSSADREASAVKIRDGELPIGVDELTRLIKLYE